MPIYNNPSELIQDAVSKGLIRLTDMSMRIGNVKIETPNAITVIDANGWISFLENIVDSTDNPAEADYVMHFLRPMQSIVQQQGAQEIVAEKIEQKITDEDVNQLKKDLDKCDTIDDVLNLVGTQIKTLPEKLHWKKPVKIQDGKVRFYSYDTDWYVERKNVNFYSIFNSEQKEVARYDKLSDAKDNMINVIKYFQQ